MKLGVTSSLAFLYLVTTVLLIESRPAEEPLFNKNAQSIMNYETLTGFYQNFWQGVGEAIVKIGENNGCENFGCHKGYCWARCIGALGGTATPKDSHQEWCYTTKGYSQDFQYVGCQQDSDCDGCWKCAGSCTL